jgi:hypothetical protein
MAYGSTAKVGWTREQAEEQDKGGDALGCKILTC